MVATLSVDDAPSKGTRKGPKCSVGTTLAALDGASAAVLQSWLDDPDYTNRALSKHLRSKGIALGDSTIRRHRVKACLCD